MKKIYIWILSLSVLILGCMDDKGNYSYSELNKITIDNIAWSNSINYGDPLNITPELSFSLDSVNVSLSYEWIVNGVVIPLPNSISKVSKNLSETGVVISAWKITARV